MEARRLLSTVTGTVFNDTNANGRHDAGEAGLAGRTVFADYDYNGVVNGSDPIAVTDATGRYTLTTRAAQVSVRVVTRPGETTSLPYGATSIWLPTVNGTVAGKNIGIAAGATTTTVSGSIYQDVNGNGRRDAGELGAYSSVYADLNTNGRQDVGEPSAMTYDSSSGDYQLTGIPIGRTVIIRAVNGASSVYQSQPGTFSPYGVTTTAAAITNIDFGFSSVGGTVSGYAFGDVNGNGVRDANAGEGEANVILWIDLNRNGVKEPDEPAPFYAFAMGAGPNDIPGSYSLTLPVGTWRVAMRTENDADLLADQYKELTISSLGQRVSFAFAVPTAVPTVNGTVFADTNRNGRLDAGEAGLEFRGVFADYNYNGLLDFNEPAAVTDGSGRYSLPVRATNVSVRVNLRENETISLPYGATSIWLPSVNGVVSGKNLGVRLPDPVTRIIVGPVLAGQWSGPRGAEYFSRIVGNYIAWEDLDDDGVRDDNEEIVTPTNPGAGGPDELGYYALIFDRVVGRYKIALSTETNVGARATLVLSIDVDGQYNVQSYFPEVPLTRTLVVGNVALGAIDWVDYAFADYNNNGTIDQDEPFSSISGISQRGYDPDFDGLYLLQVEPNRSFVLRFLARFSWVQTRVTQSSVLPNTLNTLENGLTDVAVTANVSGNVFLDANRNGVFDSSETPLAGRIVFADLNNNSQFDLDEPSATTLSDGSYYLRSEQLTNVRLRVMAYSGESVSLPGNATSILIGNLSNGATGQSLGLVTSTPVTTNISGALTWSPSSSSGQYPAATIYADLNNNNRWDAGEMREFVPIADLATYTLTNVPVGQSFTVRAISSTGRYVQATPANSSGYAITTTTAALTQRNFHFVPFTGSANIVTGTVFADTNRNGRLDAGETKLIHRTIYADYNYNGTRDIGEPEGVSNVDGVYTIATRATNVSLRLVLASGEATSLPYGATSIWLPSVNGTVTDKNFGIL